MSITGRYIDFLPDSPHDWELREEQLAFTPVEGRHNSVNQAKVLVRTVNQYGLRGKVRYSHFTCSKLF
jgi:hypothetical protein